MTRPLKYFSCFVYILFCWKRCRCIESEQLMTQYIQREYKIMCRMISVWHQSIARAIRKLKDPSALLSLSRYSDVILRSAASNQTHLHKWIGSTSLAVVRFAKRKSKKEKISRNIARALQCDYQKIFRGTCATNPISIDYLCLRWGELQRFLCVFAALSNVSQTYVDSLNAMLIRIHSLLKILEFCSLLSYASSQILSL